MSERQVREQERPRNLQPQMGLGVAASPPGIHRMSILEENFFHLKCHISSEHIEVPCTPSVG